MALYTQTDIAKELGVSPAMVSRWLKGKDFPTENGKFTESTKIEIVLQMRKEKNIRPQTDIELSLQGQVEYLQKQLDIKDEQLLQMQKLLDQQQQLTLQQQQMLIEAPKKKPSLLARLFGGSD